MSFCHAATPGATTQALADMDMGDRLDLSVVAPCYNEALGLAEFHRRVSASCSKTVGTDYEIILVNDGSQDATWSVMSELAASDAHVLAINLARNYGHQIALTAGLHYTRGKRILIVDADLQDPRNCWIR